METSFNGDDGFNLVPSTSQKSESCDEISGSSNQRSVNTKLLLAIFGCAFLVLLCLLLVIVILLLHQNAQMSSLAEQVQHLHGRIGLIEERQSNLSNDIGLKDDKSKYPFHQGFQAEQLSTTKAPSKGQKAESQNLKYLQNLNVSLSSLATKPVPDVNCTAQESVPFVQELNLSMSALAFDVKSKFSDVSTSLQEIRKILAESKDSVNEGKELFKNVTSKLSNELNKVSDDLTNSHTNLANTTMGKGDRVHLTDGVEEILSVVTGVDVNVTQMKRLTHLIECHLKSLNDILVNAPEATGQFDNTTHNSNMLQCKQNETVQCIVAALRPIKLQGLKIIERLNVISTIQLPLLSHVQTKTISELNKRFDIIHDYMNVSFSIGSNKDLNETFCDHKESCVTYKLEHLKHCYHISEDKLSWPDAQKKCKEMGGYLVEINSLSEQRFFKQSVQLSVSYWLGATDAQSEGNWVWQHSMQPMTLSTWNKGEPNNSGKEHCLMGFDKLQLWNDAPCNVKLGYICERDDGQCWQ